MKKISVSVGIPAYNEALNIRELLISLLAQKQESFTLQEVIVICDGCSDDTAQVARAVRHPFIQVVEKKDRLGQQARQNELLSLYKGEVLVLLEADTLPESEYSLDRLVSPFISEENKREPYMSVGATVVMEPTTFIDRVLYVGSNIKQRVFAQWKSGLNVYVCNGQSGRAMNRALTEKLHWPNNVPEDAYVYFSLKRLRGSLSRISKATFCSRNVNTIQDRKKQVEKFLSGKKALAEHFDEKMLRDEYRIPKALIARHVAHSLMKHPFLTTAYLVELSLNRVFFGHSRFSNLAEPTQSTKCLAACPVLERALRKLSAGSSTLPTVTVGIPAYNEEANIGYLLEDILQQKEDGFRLEKILVVSDGSTDETVKKVSEFGDTRIKLINDGRRLGLASRQNEIIDGTTSSLLVMLNADIGLQGDSFLKDAIEPILNNGADLVSVGVDIVTPTSIMERILEASFIVKASFFSRYRSGNNIYTCFGMARAFSRRYYEKLRFTESVGEDAYSYLFCVAQGFEYEHTEKARVMIKLPETLRDHLRQSQRFFSSRERFYDVFGKKVVEREYGFPKVNFILSVDVRSISRLFFLFLYGIVLCFVRVKVLFSKPTENLWAISESSKNLHRNIGSSL